MSLQYCRSRRFASTLAAVPSQALSAAHVRRSELRLKDIIWSYSYYRPHNLLFATSNPTVLRTNYLVHNCVHQFNFSTEQPSAPSSHQH